MKFCAEKVEKTKNFAQILQNSKNFLAKFLKKKENEKTNKRVNYI